MRIPPYNSSSRYRFAESAYNFIAYCRANETLAYSCERALTREKASPTRQLYALRLLSTAFLALIFGVLVYVIVRIPDSTAFLPTAWSLQLPLPTIALVVAGSLPTFFHTLGFSLILLCLTDSNGKKVKRVCTGVFLVEAAFEFGQHPQASQWLVAHFPPWLNDLGLPNHTGPALLAGVFDPFDLIAAAAGATFAALLATVYKAERRQGYV